VARYVYQSKSCELIWTQNRVGRRFGPFFSQTRLVALLKGQKAYCLSNLAQRMTSKKATTKMKLKKKRFFAPKHKESFCAFQIKLREPQKSFQTIRFFSPRAEKSPESRVARFFLVHDTKTGKMYQMNTKCTKWS
jgi:hypothetical protein